MFEADGVLRFRRIIRLNEDWRTGEAVFELIQRNEHFRAVSMRSDPYGGAAWDREWDRQFLLSGGDCPCEIIRARRCGGR